MKISKNLSVVGILVISLLSNKAAAITPGAIDIAMGAEMATKTICGIGFAGIDALIDKKVPSTIEKYNRTLIEEIKGDKNQNLKRFMNIIVKTIVDTYVEDQIAKKKKDNKWNKEYQLINTNVTGDPNSHERARKEDSMKISAANTVELLKVTIPALTTQFAKNKFSNKENLKAYLTSELKAIFTSKELFTKETGMAISFINFENILGNGKGKNWKDLITFSNGLEAIIKFLTGEILDELLVKDAKKNDNLLVRKCASKIIPKIIMEVLSPKLKAGCKKASEKINGIINTPKLLAAEAQA